MIVGSPKYIVIYEHDWSHGGDLFVMSKKLNSIKQLKGKKVGLYSNSAPVGFFLNKILNKNNMTINDLSIREVSNLAGLNKAFREGIFSAIISYDPEASKVTKDGTGALLYTSADFHGVIPEGIAVNKKLMQTNPADVQKFIRGWLKAVKWQKNSKNQREYFSILRKTMFKESKYTDQELKEFATGGKIHFDLNSITEQNKDMLDKFVKEMLNYMKQTGIKVSATNTDLYVDTSIAVKQAKSIL
jgi:NitT/TauT family transport system substrate-binding protein